MDVDYSGDDSDGPESEGNWDSVSEKYKEFSDKHLDDEIEKYKGYATGRRTGLKLRDEGAKFALCLRNLEKEKEARRIKRSLAVRFYCCGDLYCAPNVSVSYRQALHSFLSHG